MRERTAMKATRAMQGLTFEEVAKRARVKSPGHVSDIEKGKKDPSLEVKAGLAYALNASPELLFPESVKDLEWLRDVLCKILPREEGLHDG